MKNVSISLTDEQAADIEAEIATGDFSSISEVIRAALHEFFERPADGPDEQQMLADVADHEARQPAGEKLLTPEEVRASVRSLLSE